MEKRDKRLWIRVSASEMRQFKAKAKDYGCVSDMLRTAVARLDSPSISEQFRRMDELMSFCKTIDNRLSWEGGNINQLARRANEAHKAGVIPGTFFTEMLMPELTKVSNDINDIKRTLADTLSRILRNDLP